MNIKDYSYIVEIADQASLTAAAERLRITQGALSKYVRRIESELGSPLFYRHGKRFTLTPIGKLYVERGREIIRQDQLVADGIQKLKANGADAIRLGYGMGFADFILDRLLPAYFANPGVRPVSVRESSSTELIRDTENCDLDVCLAYVDSFRSGLTYVPLSPARPVLVVPDDSELLDTAELKSGYPYPVVADDRWLDEPFIRIATLTRSGATAQAYFDRIGKHPVNRLYVNDVRSALGAVYRGLGNTIVMEPPYLRNSVAYLCLPEGTREEQQMCMVTSKDLDQDESLIHMQKVVKSLYGYIS